MLKEEDSVINMGRPCDACRSAACAVYCRADSAYLCAACDASVHTASRHERVRVCQACEQAPAAFLCKADSASLCVACDADVHSANPLARRHHRVPIIPISDTNHEIFCETIDEEDENEAASWLLFNPVKASTMDEYLDLDDNSTCHDNKLKEYFSDQQQQYSYDSVVPIQSEMKTNYRLEMEFDSAKIDNRAVSSNHSVSVPSMDVGVVPESSTSEMSISHSRSPKGIIDLFSSPPIQMPTQLSPMDREARVMRYREKKKMRKFEKTIRYASRKAYAETRPRIKGRFAKRTDLEAEVDQMFSTSVFVEGGYGIVPSY